ncbi:MAG TPA: HAD-IIIA family hydrolase [Chitinispirillaceae bacterium]|nr:HAD-IIIA family hydrolase [Chitinispirillaceae bacterium]
MEPKRSFKKTAVFLDQGGTIIYDDRRDKNITLDSFIPGVFDALRKLQEKHLLFIVTNQSSVGLGKISREEAECLNSNVRRLLHDGGIRIIEHYACMHKRDDQCECIKPKPFFLRKAENEYGISLEDSFVIGDHPHDIEFASNVGARGLYVLTGHGEKHRDDLPEGVNVFQSITDAAVWIDEFTSGIGAS